MGRFDDDPPATLPEVNARLQELADALAAAQPGLDALLREQARVEREYALRFAAVVKVSKLGSEDRRKAEAETAMANERLDDSPQDLATRKFTLTWQVKGQREGMHNIRALVAAYQTISANLRTEERVTGGRP
jgi:hypothetical protein